MNISFPTKVEHGGKVRRQRRIHGPELIDLSANLNPFVPEIPWEPDFLAISEYPDDSYAELKEMIAKTFHRSVEEICVGNGSIELIRAFCAATLTPGDGFFVESPTFGEYSLSALLAGAAETSRPSEARVRFLCNPNNPTGLLRSRDEVLAELDEAALHRSVLFLDEAFIELSDPRQSLVDVQNGQLFVLRSLTKSFSVPGLRFGYGFCDPDLAGRIETARLPWTVNAFAESYAMEAFRHYGALERSRQLIERERVWLCDALRNLGLSLEPPSANFIFVHLPGPAAGYAEGLLRRQILVRDCTSFGEDHAIRIAVRTRDENARLVEALAECLP